MEARTRVCEQAGSGVCNTPYLILDTRLPLAEYTAGYRLTTRIGWLCLKASIWIAALTSALTIKGVSP